MLAGRGGRPVGDYSTIGPGTHLAQHARRLRRFHDAVIGGGPAERRAEISRLRRAIGALVSTHPYRLATGVLFDVLGEAG
jgi:hypothetical protein